MVDVEAVGGIGRVTVEHVAEVAVGRIGVPEEDRLDQGVLVDGPVDRLADVDVLELGQLLVELDPIDLVVSAELNLEVRQGVQLVDLVVGHVVGNINLASLDLQHPDIVITQDEQLDLVEIGSAGVPEMWIAPHHDPVTLGPFQQAGTAQNPWAYRRKPCRRLA